MNFLILAFLIIYVLSRQSPVRWDVNPLLNSGEHKVVNGVNATSTLIQTPQTFNASFTSVPRVILSFEGYQQSVCPQCNVGFICYSISNITTTGFISNFELYGSVTTYLYYMYLGISYQATQYFTSQNLIFFQNSSGLVDVNSTSRNQHLSFARNQLTNITNSGDFKQIIFLSGFKMNVGNNGTYINFTYQMNSSDYSMTVSTIGDVQIYGISYFRLAYNQVSIQKGYNSFIDIFSFEGVDSRQKPTVTNVTGVNFRYRNFLMGFNKINIPLGASNQVNILMQISYPPQTIYTFSILQTIRQYSIYPTYSYVFADVFHHRKRLCIEDPYFFIQSQTCFDNCPSRYYETSNQTYCSSCHFSCLQCSQRTSLDCVSCSQNIDFRILNITNNISCICKQGYFEKNISVCGRCQAYCSRCQENSYQCTQCKVNQNRELIINSTNNSCICKQGFYENSNYQPLTCLHCDARCQNCLSSIVCTSCDQIGKKRTLISNVCKCIQGFFQRLNSTNYTFCQPCNSRCLTCSVLESNCSSCNQSKKLILNNSNNCVCNDTYYQVVINSSLSCMPCHPTCLNCFGPSEYSCISCYSHQNRTLNFSNNTCQCINGYFQLSLRKPSSCIACNSTCETCQIQSINCTTCYSYQNRRLLSFKCVCIQGYFEIRENTPEVCISCNSTCKSCQGSGDFCLSCYTTHNRVLNINTHKCQCQIGLVQSTSDTNYCDYQICGNGIKEAQEECDDYNHENGDGCSSICKIQQSHSCTNFSNNNGTSLCYYSDNLLMQILSVVKIINDNKISSIIKVRAPLCNMQKLKAYLQGLSALQYEQSTNNRLLIQSRKRFLQKKIISISKANFVLSNQTSYEGYLQLLLDYSESISTLYNKKIKFVSSNQQNELKYFFNTPETSAKLKDPDNDVPITFFQKETYQTVDGISYAFLAVSVICLVYFIIGVFWRKSVIPLQNILVFQFAYFCIIGQNKVLLSLSGLAFYGRYTTGLNVDILKTITSEQQGIIHYNVCKQMGKIYQQCNSIDNINITFYISILLLIYIIVCQLYKKWMQKKVNENISVDASNKSKGSTKNKMIQNSEYYSDSQKSSVSQTSYIYELPDKVRLSVEISLEFISGIFFMTSIQFLSTAVNISVSYLISSVIWLCFVAIFFGIFWSYYYFLYPIKNYSFKQIMKHRFERFTLQKNFYFILFLLIFGWGGLVSSSLIPGIASYIILMVWSILWAFFTVKKDIYRNRIQTIRVIVNQVLIFLIGLLFVISEYAVSDGLGLGYAVVILLFLCLSLVNNIFFQIFDEYKRAQISKQVNDEEGFKNVEQQYRSKVINKQQVEGSRYFATNKHEKVIDLTSPKMRPKASDGQSQSKQSVMRYNQLKEIKRNIKKQLDEEGPQQEQDSQRVYRNFQDNQVNYQEKL